LFDLLVEQAERYPNHLAVVSAGRQYTYPQLLQSVLQVAGALLAAGVGRGDRVGALINNRVEWLQLCFGTAAIGAVLCPFSTWSKRTEIGFLLGDSNVNLVVALDCFGELNFADDLAHLVPEACRARPGEWRSSRYPTLHSIVVIDSAPFQGCVSYSSFLSAGHPLVDAMPPGTGSTPDSAAVVVYTSGSTAHPKAVPLTHRGIIENGFNIGERQGLRPGDRVLVSPPLFWSYGCANAMGATLTHGAALVLQGKFDAAEAIDLIERYACTSIYTLPGMTSAILSQPSFSRDRTRSLRTGMTLGTPSDVQTAAEALAAPEICNMYGQTESYGVCCVAWHHWPLEKRMRGQGMALPGVTLRIVDLETGVPLPPGELGLIEVKGHLTPGYTGASASVNADAFTIDGFFKAGDLGQLNTDGELQFVGRSTERIKKGGINIAPVEVEELLQSHPAVARAGVSGASDPIKGEIIVAFVVRQPGAVITAAELNQHCRSLAANFKVPDRTVFCDTLPETTTGKLLRRELKARAAALSGLCGDQS